MRRNLPLQAALILVCFTSTLFGASEKRHEPVARMTGNSAVIEWSPIVDHERLQLTVITPDLEVFSREFPAGRNPSYRLQDHPGARGAVDGVYSYEIRVIPRISAAVRKALENARRIGDDAAITRIRREAGIEQTLVQSGAFSVLNGSFLDPDRGEPSSRQDSTPAAHESRSGPTGSGGSNGGDLPVNSYVRLRPGVNDQVIPDDLIVQSSACVGFDCVNGEVFDFDTVRLKENNLRLHFLDTSTIAGFPTNDWRLIANDSASGGANKFSIEDSTAGRSLVTFRAGSPINSLFIDSAGNVGLGTGTPVLDLHVTRSDTPAARFEQTNAGGFTAQTWDVAGNEANFFVRDVTGGSRLPLRIRPGAPTSSLDIAASGNVGIGTSSPQAALHVVSEAGYYAQFERDAVRTWGFDNSGGFFTLTDVTAGLARFTVDTAGNVGVGTTTPSSKFHVSGGDIRVSGGSFIDDGVTLNVPDYVFADTYHLMPLEKLAEFIQTEKHLPNVPDADTIKSRGLNMSQFQMRLLEKIEELTLYTIDLKAQNDRLQTRLNALEQLLKQQ